MRQLSELLSSSSLQKRLETLSGKLNRTQCHVGLLNVNSAAYASLSTRETPPKDQFIFVGCCMKLFTARLMEQSAQEHRLNFDDDISDHLIESCPAQAGQLTGITIRHLLEHTHGLDDGLLLHTAPQMCNGKINIKALCATLTANERIAKPGKLYSYSHVGSWICAAILEKIWRKPYAQILGEQLLKPLGIASSDVHHLQICAATGGRLALQLADWMKFLKSAMDTWNQHHGIDSVFSNLPGWSIMGRAITLGWHSFPDGWYGHNSLHPEPVLLRIHPQSNLAIILASNSHPPLVLAGRLFGDALPELISIDIPRTDTVCTLGNTDPQQYLGWYGNASLKISISGSIKTALQMQTYRMSQQGAPLLIAETQLLRTTDNFFLLQNQIERLFSFVQFLSLIDGKYRYIWNGQSIWTRRAVDT